MRTRAPKITSRQQGKPHGDQSQSYLCISVDVLIESLECINIELHQLPQEVKVTLEHIP